VDKAADLDVATVMAMGFPPYRWGGRGGGLAELGGAVTVDKALAVCHVLRGGLTGPGWAGNKLLGRTI
jgi:hypothetical protein